MLIKILIIVIFILEVWLNVISLLFALTSGWSCWNAMWYILGIALKYKYYLEAFKKIDFSKICPAIIFYRFQFPSEVWMLNSFHPNNRLSTCRRSTVWPNHMWCFAWLRIRIFCSLKNWSYSEEPLWFHFDVILWTNELLKFKACSWNKTKLSVSQLKVLSYSLCS